MGKDDKILQQLMAMSRPELQKMAGKFDPPIYFKHDSRKQLAHKIRRRQLKEEQKKSTQSTESKQPDKVSDIQPANADFEQALKEPQEVEPDEIKSGKGGWRPGAGRPLGMTAEKAKVKNLPQIPNQAIKQGLEALFELWASATKIEEIALSEDEANLLSLPVTQLQEYYFPGIIPEIAGTWVMLIFAATKVVKPRIKKIEQVHKEQRSPQDGQGGHTPDIRKDGIREDGQSPQSG